MTATVLRYSYPLTMTSTEGRFPCPSCAMTCSGTSMPVLFPWEVKMVSKVTPSCCAGVMALQPLRLQPTLASKGHEGTAGTVDEDNTTGRPTRACPRVSKRIWHPFVDAQRLQFGYMHFAGVRVRVATLFRGQLATRWRAVLSLVTPR